MNNINIRTATIHDIQEIQTLLITTIKSTYIEDYTPEQIDTWLGIFRKKIGALGAFS